MDPFFQVFLDVARTDFTKSNDPEVKLLRRAIAHSMQHSARTMRCVDPSLCRPLPRPNLSVSPTNIVYMIDPVAEEQPRPKRQRLVFHVPPKSLRSSLEDAWTQKCLAVVGESRLKVRFENRGKLGALPQRFGKSGLLVADGLSGTHDMYEQPWRFQVTQGPAVDKEVALITWSITNLSSGRTKSVTETSKQASVRHHSGRTICNQVLKDALTERYTELEALLPTLQNNPTREANVKSMMKVVAPRRCTVGLLFCGLLHECIQSPFEKNFPGGIPAPSANISLTRQIR